MNEPKLYSPEWYAAKVKESKCEILAKLAPADGSKPWILGAPGEGISGKAIAELLAEGKIVRGEAFIRTLEIVRTDDGEEIIISCTDDDGRAEAADGRPKELITRGVPGRDAIHDIIGHDS
jgi:hypothetical protein